MKSGCSIAIVGAGIAGLSVAIAARNARQNVSLFDKAAASGNGSVLLLWPNGMNAAKALGIDGAITDAGTPVLRTEFKLWNGSRLWEIDVRSFERRYGAHAILISRRALIDVMLHALSAPDVAIAECTGFTEYSDSVAPRFATPTSGGAFDALIGCDGLSSPVRNQLRPNDDGPRSAYHSAWIGLSDVDAEEWRYPIGHTVTFLGHGLRFCASTMKESGVTGERRVYWYATEAVSGLESNSSGISPRQLVELFATVSGQVAALIQASQSNTVLQPLRIHIQDRSPVRTWTRRRVTLAGDAAHPCTPDLGQGACQALESAAVIGRCIEEANSLPQALQRYERLRIDRTARVTELSRVTAIQSMTRGPFVESIRELGIRTLLPGITRQQFESLFSYEF